MENIEIKHSNTLDRDCRYPKATFLGGRPLPQRIRWNKEVNSQKIEEIQIVDTCKKANHISGEIAPQKKRSNDQKLAVEQKSVILKAKEHISEDVTTPIVWKSLSADKTKHRFNVKYPISYFEISVAHADSVTVEESSWGVHINGDVNMDIARPFPLCRIRAQYRMRSKRLRIYFQQIPGDHESHAVDRQATAPKAHPLNAEAKNPSVAGTTLKNKLQFRLA
uniref:Uncharacterized protein n=1 Tax=Spongospora subterranea TaxID=70186 RepID=A0A0H5RDT4_9EUKA|eukprot:CRZ12405.1 hypothetical protein [Spongospora subterranea]